MNDRFVAVAALIAWSGLRRSIALTLLYGGLFAVQTGPALAACPDPDRPAIEEDEMGKRLNYYGEGGYYCSAGPDSNVLGLPAGPYLCGAGGQFQPAPRYLHACPTAPAAAAAPKFGSGAATGGGGAITGQRPPSSPSISSAPSPAAPVMPPTPQQQAIFNACTDVAWEACKAECGPGYSECGVACLTRSSRACAAQAQGMSPGSAALPPQAPTTSAAGAGCIPLERSGGYEVCRADRQQQQPCRGDQRPDCDQWSSLAAAPGEACWPDHQGRKIFWCPPASFEIYSR